MQLWELGFSKRCKIGFRRGQTLDNHEGGGGFRRLSTKLVSRKIHNLIDVALC